MKFPRTRLAVTALIISWSVHPYANAEVLSAAATFHRCYTQITGLRAKENDPQLVAVKAGQKTAVNACMEVLTRGNLTTNGNRTISNTSDPVAKGVLATFHRLHSSWFYSKDYPIISWAGHTYDDQNIIDSTTPAMYFTRALLRPNTQVSDALTTTEYLEAVRTNMNPTAGAASGHGLADYAFTTAFKFAPVGELTGIQTISNSVMSYSNGTFDLYPNWGGGFLGTNSYMLLNISQLPSGGGGYKTNGALAVHRKWGKAVYRDVLCRELPVVRSSDVATLVDSSSPTAFRTSASCTKCHASHDRISNVVRGVHVVYIGIGDPTAIGLKQRGGVFPKLHTVNMPAETAWPSRPDADFYRRPASGNLFFRNHAGELIDQSVTGLADLGQKLAATDDYYICLAKRYYLYFTGIEVDTGDLADPEHYNQPNSQDLEHRKIVVNLGQKLKTHQSLSTLIRDILNLPHYKNTDSGSGGGVVAQQ